MIIAQVTKYFYPTVKGGIENMVYNLSKEIIIYGYDPVIITKSINKYKETNYLVQSNLKIECINLRKLRNKLLEIDPNIVHIHNIHRIETDILSFSKFSVPFVLTTHGGLASIGFLRNPIKKGILRAHDFFLTPRIINKIFSKIVALGNHEEFFLRKIGIERSKIVVIPNGIPDTFFEKHAQTNPTKLPIYDHPYILSLARISPIKKLEDIILSMKHLPNQLHYIIAGEGSEEYRNYLETVAESLGISKRIHFVGYITGLEKINLIKNSMAFVLSSIYEEQSIAVLEAMALGTVPVVSNVGGMGDIVSNNSNGFLFQLGNINELSLILKNLYENNHLRLAIGESASSFAVEYKWSKISRKYVTLYDSIMR